MDQLSLIDGILTIFIILLVAGIVLYFSYPLFLEDFKDNEKDRI
jgi:hypothetical protein